MISGQKFYKLSNITWTESPGGTPLYLPYRCVPPPRVIGMAFHLCRFGLKTGINFAYFGLNSGMVFEGTRECLNIFVASIPNK